MKKVININFQGRILPIEEEAFEILKQYIETLSVYFTNEEGRDEIINDIECRVAELCEDKLKKGSVCITVEDIDLIIVSIGRPADFEAQDGFEANASYSNNYYNEENESHNNFSSTRPKRLYRDEQNKVLGGVCSGIANYFGLEPLLVRILWIFLIGVNVLGYLILWIAVPSSSVKEVGGVRKRLFRDIDNKVIGGVASGLSKYFGLQVWIIRVLFLIPFIRFVINFRHMHLFQFWDAPDFPNFLDITFSPGAVFVYIVLWLVLPEAKTSADKLEMVGEKVDLNSIKNTIQNDMEGFSKRAQGWGSELKNKYQSSKENTSQNSDTTNASSEKKKGILYYIGRAITIAIKAFVYFILAIIGVSLLAALFGIGVAGTSLLPLKGFILEDGAQTWAAFGTILFFVWVPILAIVTAIIRKIAGFKKSNIWVRSSFIALWVFGWICLFYFFSSLGNSFSKHNVPNEEWVALKNPHIDYLEITSSPKLKYYEGASFNITPFNNVSGEDTLYVRNLHVRIVQSKTDSFEIKVVKLTNGKTIQEANQLAKEINFNLSQIDSLLYLDRGIKIHKNNKFRNQHLIMTIAVPIGKRIKINKNNWGQVNVKINRTSIQTETLNGFSDGWFDEWNEPWDNESYSYEQGVEYKMTTTGLEKTKRDQHEDIDEGSDDENDKSDNIEQKLNKLKEERLKIEKKTSIHNAENEKNISKLASKFTELNWVLDRFSY